MVGIGGARVPCGPTAGPTMPASNRSRSTESVSSAFGPNTGWIMSPSDTARGLYVEPASFFAFAIAAGQEVPWVTVNRPARTSIGRRLRRLRQVGGSAPVVCAVICQPSSPILPSAHRFSRHGEDAA
jgi:hypothetical protein